MDILFDNQWIQIRKKDYYVYAHLKWCNGVGVAVLPYRKNSSGQKEYLGRFEICPPHGDGFKLGSITGGYDNAGKFNIKECALNELAEEAGYLASPGDLIDLGTVYVSKISDTIMYLFSINLDSACTKKVEAAGDGSKGEEGAYCRWVSQEDAVNCDDPLLITLITRLEYVNP